MKQKEITLNIQPDLDELIDEVGEQHAMTNIKTPLRDDAFELDDETKIELIEKHFHQIMEIMGLDLSDESLKGTPRRVAKMYIKELFSGLNPQNMPALTLFTNDYKYGEMLVERNIKFHSNCEHHFVPIVGHAHVAYVSTGKVIGLSKLHRIVNYYARRPQVQERMTIQVGNALKEALQTEDVAVILDADHMCVSSRGVGDQSSSTVTAFYSGVFQKDAKKEEFLKMIRIKD
ncbi:GTP cyclohydrolase I FolE [Marinilongibacter aquaticus]|uniref:GTP cyclohydrolase I FolE n=1 Tax=Marinilongibacter aquaticus TaxID=2975157 RepID=UPI0021BD805F|nr:GTP cyclohydrolase I FolE [Marinilongibacter aquaticus]UBM59685.1 GTP cyclohydrolase I FolE [Marinilongibacter aquaticus]